MTTFSFVDQEYTVSSNNNSYLTPRSIYTVPSGKIAKIHFDSFFITHNAAASSATAFKQAGFILYSDGTNVHRKHMYGRFEGAENDIMMVSFYNPMDYSGSRHNSNNGSQSANYEYTMFAQPENFINSGTPETNMSDSSTGYYDFTSNRIYGGRVYGPSDFYMEAGEVLKLNAYANTDNNTTKYFNVRLAIFLEDE